MYPWHIHYDCTHLRNLHSRLHKMGLQPSEKENNESVNVIRVSLRPWKTEGARPYRRERKGRSKQEGRKGSGNSRWKESPRHVPLQRNRNRGNIYQGPSDRINRRDDVLIRGTANSQTKESVETRSIRNIGPSFTHTHTHTHTHCVFLSTKFFLNACFHFGFEIVVLSRNVNRAVITNGRHIQFLSARAYFTFWK